VRHPVGLLVPAGALLADSLADCVPAERRRGVRAPCAVLELATRRGALLRMILWGPRAVACAAGERDAVRGM